MLDFPGLFASHGKPLAHRVVAGGTVAHSGTLSGLEADSFSVRFGAGRDVSLEVGALLDVNDGSLLPGFSARPICWDGIERDQVVYVHLTDYPPKDGKISSVFRTGAGPRDSIHFTLNHAVSKHFLGNWDHKKYAVLVPGDVATALNKKPDAGNEVDAWWSGAFNVNAPEAVLLVHQPSVPFGKLKVLAPEAVGLAGDTKTLILGTSVSPHRVTDKVIEKMGRTVCPGGNMSWAPKLDMNNSFSFQSVTAEDLAPMNAARAFFAREGIPYRPHSYSPFFKFEACLFGLARLAEKDQWEFDGVDCKPQITGLLNDVLRETRPGADGAVPLPLDVSTLLACVESADTPGQALKRIEAETGFPVRTLRAGASGIQAKFAVEGYDEYRRFDAQFGAFYEKPVVTLADFETFFADTKENRRTEVGKMLPGASEAQVAAYETMFELYAPIIEQGGIRLEELNIFRAAPETVSIFRPFPRVKALLAEAKLTEREFIEMYHKCYAISAEKSAHGEEGLFTMPLFSDEDCEVLREGVGALWRLQMVVSDEQIGQLLRDPGSVAVDLSKVYYEPVTMAEVVGQIKKAKEILRPYPPLAKASGFAFLMVPA